MVDDRVEPATRWKEPRAGQPVVGAAARHDATSRHVQARTRVLELRGQSGFVRVDAGELTVDVERRLPVCGQGKRTEREKDDEGTPGAHLGATGGTRA